MSNIVYGFSYCGFTGVGSGVFAVRDDGAVEGNDSWGGRYEGRAAPLPDGGRRLDLTMHIPPGVILVQGTAPAEIWQSRTFSIDLPAAFDQGSPMTVSIPPGEVSMFIRRVPDDDAVLATFGGFTIYRERLAGIDAARRERFRQE
jgi:hypothetical protein